MRADYSVESVLSFVVDIWHTVFNRKIGQMGMKANKRTMTPVVIVQICPQLPRNEIEMFLYAAPLQIS